MPEVTLFNGQSDYYEINDFTDPWRAADVATVVFQPGLTRHSEMLYHLAPLFSRQVRFIRRDLRGHGRSSIGDADGYAYDVDTLVDEMADFVDRVAQTPVHWIGESTAGMLAIAFARKHPDKLKSLILMSTPLALGEEFRLVTSEPYNSPGEAVRKLGLVEWQRTRPISKLGTNQKNGPTNDMGRFSGPAYQKWWNKMLARHNPEGIASYFDFIMPLDVTDYLPEIKVPTLVLAPRNSMASPVALNRDIADRIQHSSLVIIESVGHMMYMDRPEETVDAILQWIRELGAKE